MTTVYDFAAETIDGELLSLKAYEGQGLLIVNTASDCIYTPQFKGLQALHDKFAPLGFSVLGFPCNQFANQDPGTNEEIQAFCSTTYGVTFPMFAKIVVNGAKAHPLYQLLTASLPGDLGSGIIKWNFTKFLINRRGEPIRRYAPVILPVKIEKEIERMLG